MKRNVLFTLTFLVLIGGIYFFKFSKNPNEDVFKHPEILDYIYLDGTIVNPEIKKADIYKYAQDYPKAAAAFQKLITGNTLNRNEKQYAFNQLAFIYLNMNEDSIARISIDSIEKYCPLSKEAEADYFYNVGVWGYHTFKPKMAEGYLRKALDDYETSYDKNHLKLGLCLTQLGLLEYDFEQKMEDLIIYTTRAYDIFQSKPKLIEYSANCELAMGLYNYLQRGHELAEAHCENAIYLAKNKKWKDTILISRALSYKGQMLKKKAEKALDPISQKKLLDSAESYFLRSIVNFGNLNHVRIQELYRNLLVLYCFQKDSLKFFNNNEILQKHVNSQGNYYGFNDRLIGYFMYFKGDIQKSISQYLKFINQSKNDSLCNIALKQEAYIILIRNYLKNGNFDIALKHCLGLGKYDNVDEVISDNKQLNNNNIYNRFLIHQYVGESLLLKFKKNKKIDDLLKCIDVYVTADSLLFVNKISNNEDIQIRFQKDVGEDLYDKALDALYECYSNNQNPQLLDLAFRFAERMKSSVLFRDINFINNDDSLKYIKTEVEKLLVVHERADIYNYELSQKYCSLSRLLEIKLKKKKNEPYHIPTISNIKKIIEPQQVVLQYFLHKNAFGLLISKDTVQFLKLNSDSLKNNLDIYKKCVIVLDPIKTQTFKPDFKASSSYLYNTLISPFESLIKNKKEILIIPDKVLHNIPFESFVSHSDWNKYRDAPYLIKNNIAITYAPSWKIYNRNVSTEGFHKFKALCFYYGKNKTDLLCSEDEIKTIENKLGTENVKTYSNNECSKKKFLNEWQKDYNIVHISLHANGSLTDLFDNKIAFNIEQKDYLYGYELSSYTTNKDLIVLSACETGLGNASAGEGAYSLARYFFQTGAKNVMATLWQVDDCQNAKIVDYFYTNFIKYQKTKSALSQAKCQFLSENKDDFLFYPSFWAGMICLD